MKNRGAGLLLAIILSCFMITTGYAEENEAETTMKTVVVTATRIEQEVQRIAANVTVIDQEDIKNSNANNVPDLLRSEEGIQVRDLMGNGKSAQVDLRGFGETGPYNSSVLVDGRRVNEIDLSGVDWTQIPLEQIERIEIVRGTGTVLYGDNAVGGVINIITKRPSKGLSYSAEAIVGSYGRNKELISISGGSGDIAASLFASYDSTNGYRDDSGFRTKDIGGKVVFDPTENLSFNLSGSYHEDDYALPGPLTEFEYNADRQANMNPLDGGNTEDYYLKTGVDLELGEYGNIVADLSYRNRDNDSWFPDPSGVFPQGSELNVETWSITPRYILNNEIFNCSNTFIAGVDLYWAEQKINSSGGFNTPITTLTGVADIERDSSGFYLNDEFSIFDNLILSVGARYERVKYDLSKTDLSPFPLAPLDETITDRENAYSAGLTYLYGDKSSAFIRANRSFRFPLTDEVVYIDWVSWKIMANTDLKPQTGKHYELGINHSFNSDTSGNVTFFRAEIKNELFYNPSTFENTNHPETIHQGIEVGGKTELFRMLTFYGNYTYEKAEFEKDPYKNNEIPAVPKHKGNLGVRVHGTVPGFIFSADYHYVGSSYLISDQENNFKKLDHYHCIDARVSYEWKMLNAFVGVNNITNEEYSEYAVMDTFLTGRNFYSAPERNWLAGLEIAF
ncbi:MAG: TonB-dependent receptor [Deltaproteobacteria bacterium]|nr:TonB-dependent receptor [Deltaproteobacteria bacterium]